MRTYANEDFAREIAGVANAMNKMFAREFRPYDYARNGGSLSPANGTSETVAYRLPVDAWADEDAYHVVAYVPGVQPEDVEITFEGDELRIRGEFPKVVEGTDFAKRELFRGTFERRVTFNVPVNADAIEATYENGVLDLRVPKAEAAKPKQIKVTPRSSIALDNNTTDIQVAESA
jgi:HSP20 family protein